MRRRVVLTVGAVGLLGAVVPIAYAGEPSVPTAAQSCSSVSSSGSLGTHNAGPYCVPNLLPNQECAPVGGTTLGETWNVTVCSPSV